MATPRRRLLFLALQIPDLSSWVKLAAAAAQDLSFAEFRDLAFSQPALVDTALEMLRRPRHTRHKSSGLLRGPRVTASFAGTCRFRASKGQLQLTRRSSEAQEESCSLSLCRMRRGHAPGNLLLT